MKKVLLVCFLTTLAFCKEGVSPEVAEPLSEQPWTAGTLLAPLLTAIPPGYLNIQPYAFIIDIFGAYDNHWHRHSIPDIFYINPLFFFSAGIVKNVDVQIYPQAFYTRRQGKASLKFGDLNAGFDFQLLTEGPDNKIPTATLFLVETFPTGKYQHLNPDKNGTDAAGNGSFTTNAGITFSRLFHITGKHFVYPYLSLQYSVPSHVHVKEFNSYGGGFGTNGTIRPGNIFSLLFGGELTLSQNWVFALDVVNTFGAKTTFSGKRGIDELGKRATLGGPAFIQISLAPGLEYNFSDEFAILSSAWFTVAGKNAHQFAGAILSLYWYFPVY